MPQGLAPVTRYLRSGLVFRRLLACLVLASATLLAPLESGILPDPLDHLTAQSRARAQTPSVVDGNPNACPDGFDAAIDSSLCRVERPACPYSPYNTIRGDIRFMDGSTEYPEFCEETVYAGPEPEAYALCAGDPTDRDLPSLPGYAVELNPAAQACRALQVRTCEVGSRTHLNWCRATIRRSWTCREGQIPLNQYPKCRAVADDSPDTDPVCTGLQDHFIVVSCEDYIGNDFTASGDCDSYGATDPWEMRAVSANSYWCEFNQALLRAGCHGTSPPDDECQESWATCLKRASRIGGCDGIARALLCRSVQADYRAEAETLMAASNPPGSDVSDLARRADSARRQGCEPCQALPFEPVPDHCPEDRVAVPAYTTLRSNKILAFQHQVLEHGLDIPETAGCEYLASYDPQIMTPECLARPRLCASPPPGSAVWSSTHYSGLAVVNSSVVVQVQDVPVNDRPVPRRYPSFNIFNDDLREARNHNLLIDSVALFPGDPRNLMRTSKSGTNPAREYDDVAWVGNLAHKCVVSGLPAFRLIVEEFWPDKEDDKDAITELFGAHSLDWWEAITDEKEKRNRTLARGQPYWPDLTTGDQRRARDERLLTKIDCNVERGVASWCRWDPERSGYFRLKVAGAWRTLARGGRSWRSARDLTRLRAVVQGLDEEQKVTARRNLQVLGCGLGQPIEPTCDVLTPGALGVTDDFTDLRATGPGGGWDEFDLDYLYQLAGDHHRYGGLDLRVTHKDPFAPPTIFKYSETQSFRIQVHDVRVHTVAPSR